jgi:thiol:disulfide interchange protein DsbD
MTRGWLAAVGLALAAALASAAAQPLSTAHVTAELVAERSAVQPGQPIRIGLRLQHQPHWHTYWRNPGDSGLPTTLSWTLPALSQIDEIVWPVPRRLWIGPLVNYGFEGELLLPQVYLPAVDARVGSTLELQAVASWLVCKEVCIPETVTLALQLPVAPNTRRCSSAPRPPNRCRSTAGPWTCSTPGATCWSVSRDRAPP